MSARAIAALVLVCIWLGVLTLVLVLLVRQVGLLTVRLSVAGEAASLDNDGPEIGSSVPEDVAVVLPDQAEEHAYLLLIDLPPLLGPGDRSRRTTFRAEHRSPRARPRGEGGRAGGAPSLPHAGGARP